ncbi:tetratricopeptide repeat protein [Formosa maritima]|nr:hypothetical protein [Formosa maritima]
MIVTLLSLSIHSQSNYEKGMEKAFSFWELGDINAAEQLFERIANAEPTEWLPNYYIAQINSLKSWEEKDATIIKAQLDKAQSYLDIAKSISKDNPEIMVLQAHIYTNWVVFDGAFYGMKYGATISELYENAFKIDPENPRVVFSKADWAYGSAQYFGQDTTPYCKEIKESLELFANFKPVSKFAPNWGLERAVQVLNECK